MQEAEGEKLIEDLWDKNGVNNNDGEITIAELVKQGQIQVGDYIDYEKLIGEERTYQAWNTKGWKDSKNDDIVIGEREVKSEDLRWRVLYIDEEKGGITLISEKPTYTTFNVPDGKSTDEIINELNKECNALYGANGYECRNLDYKDVLEGYQDYNNIADIIVGSGHDENYYYEYSGDGDESWFDYLYYPMIMTNVSKLGGYEELVGIWQSLNENGGRTPHPDTIPHIYEPCSWADKNVGYVGHGEPLYSDYLPMRPVIVLKGSTKIYNLYRQSIPDVRSCVMLNYVFEHAENSDFNLWKNGSGYYEKDGNMFYWISSSDGTKTLLSDENILNLDIEKYGLKGCGPVKEISYECLEQLLQIYKSNEEDFYFYDDSIDENIYYFKDDNQKWCWQRSSGEIGNCGGISLSSIFGKDMDLYVSKLIKWHIIND